MLRNPLLAGALPAGISPYAMLALEEGEGEGGGGTPAPSPAPAPAPAPAPSPTPEPSLLGGDDEPPADDGLTDEQKAEKVEEERRAALSDDERAEEDRRAALTDEERKAEDDAKALAEAGAPETYDFAAVFEGEDAPQLDEALLEDFTGMLREDNLTQAQANRYMEFAGKLQEKWLGEITQAHVDMRAAWRKEAQTDPEIGGDKFAENLAKAKTVLNAFASDKLKEQLNETGFGDNPEFLRMMYKLGVVNSEHDFVKAGKPAAVKPFYDHETSQRAKK